LLTPEERKDFFGIYTTKEQYFEILFRRKELLNILIKNSKKSFLNLLFLKKLKKKI